MTVPSVIDWQRATIEDGETRPDQDQLILAAEKCEKMGI